MMMITVVPQLYLTYFSCIQAHPGVLGLSNQEALTALEQLTHATRDNPAPIMPLSEVATNIPALFRRAAIHAALGSARSFYTLLEKWRKRKEKAQASGKPWKGRPPVPPRTWQKSVTLYTDQWKERTSSTILLKLWTGRSWVWVKCRYTGRELPEGWESSSPQLVRHGKQWWVHTRVEKHFEKPGTVKTQLGCPGVTICAVDLNLDHHLAVCSILEANGTPVASCFIGQGDNVNGRRKTLLGRIARNRRWTGVLAEGEQDNSALWAKIHGLDEQVAHLVSRRIVDFAIAHGATVLVFEHLGSLTPEKGRYSRRANQKRAYWMKGRIFRFAPYKAWEAGLVTCRVNPKGTSRQCAVCHHEVARYKAGQPEKGYTPGAPLVLCLNTACGHRDHADLNASVVIGQRLFARYQETQGKPHTPSSGKRSAKAGGVVDSQDAKRADQPSSDHARHGINNAHGTAHHASSGLAEHTSGIPRSLRLFTE